MNQFLFAIMIILYSVLSFQQIYREEDKFLVICFSVVNSLFILACTIRIIEI